MSRGIVGADIDVPIGNDDVAIRRRAKLRTPFDVLAGLDVPFRRDVRPRPSAWAIESDPLGAKKIVHGVAIFKDLN